MDLLKKITKESQWIYVIKAGTMTSQLTPPPPLCAAGSGGRYMRASSEMNRAKICIILISWWVFLWLGDTPVMSRSSSEWGRLLVEERSLDLCNFMPNPFRWTLACIALAHHWRQARGGGGGSGPEMREAYVLVISSARLKSGLVVRDGGGGDYRIMIWRRFTPRLKSSLDFWEHFLKFI